MQSISNVNITAKEIKSKEKYKIVTEKKKNHT